MAPSEPFEWLLWQFGYSICHQMGDRSLFVDGHQYPIDARMSGIFLGFLVASLYLLLMDRWRRAALPDKVVMGFAIAGAMALVFDGATSYAGLRPTTNLIRLSTGLAMGAAVGLLMPAVWKAVMSGGEPPAPGSVKVATWRDLPVVYGLTFVTGAAIYTTTTGLMFYYIVATSVIISYVALLHLSARILVMALLAQRFAWLRSGRRQVVAALALQAVMTAALWSGHFAVDRAMGVV